MTKKLMIEIELENYSLSEPGSSIEVERILRNVNQNLARFGIGDDFNMPLYDFNGNKVGFAMVVHD